jgi:hypothetical protein
VRADERDPMVLIQLLLPVTTATSDPDADERVRQTRRELVDAFGGITAYLRTPAQGVWTSPQGDRESDAVVMVEIVTGHFDRTWWQPYAAALAARFDQEVIHVRALAVEVL